MLTISGPEQGQDRAVPFDCGHFPAEERPEETGVELVAFLRHT